MREFMFMFPEIKSHKGPLPDRDMAQAFVIGGEVNELMSAFIDREPVERIAEEAFDVIHACETLIRHLDVNPKEMRDMVEAKNRKRGYYDDVL